MARPSRPVRHVSDDDDDDEFPDVAVLVRQKRDQLRRDASRDTQSESRRERPEAEKPAKAPAPAPAAVRRRKLGQVADNTLLRAWTPDSAGGGEDENDQVPCRAKKADEKPWRPRVELRTRTKTTTAKKAVVYDRPIVAEDYVNGDDISEQEATITEDVSVMGRTQEPDNSESEASFFTAEEESDEDEQPFIRFASRRPPAKPRLPGNDRKLPAPATVDLTTDTPAPRIRSSRAVAQKSRKDSSCDCPPAKGKNSSETTQPSQRDLTDPFSRLQLDGIKLDINTNLPHPRDRNYNSNISQNTTPPRSPPPPSHIPQHQQPGLVSPKKLPRIPNTPHRASSDAFWSREFIDDWNDEHSPKKILFPDATKSKTTTAKKTTSSSKPPSTTTTTSKPPSKTALAASAREAKKSFAAAKHALAESFLAELDETITAGQLSALAASTGGIKLNWTNKLNTTAGRANWKRETVRTKAAADPTSSASVTTTTKHHASIELAEKVIDDEHRLLNVIAHEFCHLANFMISGVTTNPHGKEFKVWAARCSRAFGESRGIEVTTKHSYDIDFKYAWTCVDCGMEFKRHSRSIDPKRHRCGACKSELRQTKPVPRVAKDGGKQGPSEYQVFMKEQMAVVRGENPGSPQKEIMRLVAGRWAERRDGGGGGGGGGGGKDKGVDRGEVEELGRGIEVLEIED